MSNVYSTTQTFGNHRAAVGRTVIVVDNGQTMAGVIVAVYGDYPTIRTLAADSSGKSNSLYGSRHVACPFKACATELDLANGTACFWTWPPRV